MIYYTTGIFRPWRIYPHLLLTSKLDATAWGMRSGHNEAVLKNSRYCHCKIVKALDFIGFFVGSSARCEKRFSQFSRKFLAGFSQFPNVFEPILNWFGDCLGQFNSLRRHIEAVITRLS